VRLTAAHLQNLRPRWSAAQNRVLQRNRRKAAEAGIGRNRNGCFGAQPLKLPFGDACVPIGKPGLAFGDHDLSHGSSQDGLLAKLVRSGSSSSASEVASSRWAYIWLEASYSLVNP
jgi:hypothetical protein